MREKNGLIHEKPAKTLEPRAAFPWKKFIFSALLLGGAAFFAHFFIFTSEAGYHYIYHNQFNDEYKIYSEPGTHFRLPVLSKIIRYQQVVSVVFGDIDNKHEASLRLEPITVRFADTYTAEIPAAFRYKLAEEPEKILKMHREFRSFSNLRNSLLAKHSRNAAAITATQYTAVEFFEGAQAQFEAKLKDQLDEGIYQTERRQVETALGTMQWKTVPIADKDGNIQRVSNPLEPYGIRITQVKLGKALPEGRLRAVLERTGMDGRMFGRIPSARICFV